MKDLIFYKTTADFANTGEVLIYSSLLQFLRKYGHVVIDDSPSNDPLFLERIGVRNEERLSSHSKLSFIPYMLRTSIRSLCSKQRIWFVTGVGEHSIKGTKSVIKNLLAFCFLFVMRCCGVRILRIGMSMRFGGRWERWSERLLSLVVNFYYVRDSISQSNCKQAGVYKCQLAPDLSWGFKVDYCGVEEKNVVVLSFRDFCESNDGKKEYKSQLTKCILQVIDYYTENPHCQQILLTHQCNVDLDYMREIYSLCNHEKIKLIEELVTLDNANEYYGRAGVIFSNRLHVILLGYKFGSPTICLSDIQKHRKIRGILMDNNLREVLLDINVDGSDLTDGLRKIDCGKTEIEMVYINAETLNYQRLSDIFESIFTNR